MRPSDLAVFGRSLVYRLAKRFPWAAAVAVFLWQVRGVRGDPWARALLVGSVGAFGAVMIGGITEPSTGYEHSLLLNAELALLTGTVVRGGGGGDPREQKPGAREVSR